MYLKYNYSWDDGQSRAYIDTNFTLTYSYVCTVVEEETLMGFETMLLRDIWLVANSKAKRTKFMVDIEIENISEKSKYNRRKNDREKRICVQCE